MTGGQEDETTTLDEAPDRAPAVRPPDVLADPEGEPLADASEEALGDPPTDAAIDPPAIDPPAIDPPEEALAQVAAAVLGPASHRVVDLLDVVEGMVAAPVDVVRAGDDLLPRLAHENVLADALSSAREVLRPGGLLVAAVPELERLRRLRPVAPPPRVTGHGEDRQVTVQLWDWAEDGESYGLEVLQLVREHGTWELARTVSTEHRVLSADQVADLLDEAGFVAVHRLTPAESGHPLPVWVAVAPR
ncbi:hypothetical protein [Goodfellowiella coeruleoviolacea]|uniref:hypothetical protein n=1 Tax=Goodfellowiella coeruleoviolacea TaxID=334858 RepID=UPI0020A58065|nr:hypothetical protein [Goodfellowiella coeruleoviolacea]